MKYKIKWPTKCEWCGVTFYELRDCPETGYESRTYHIGYEGGEQKTITIPELEAAGYTSWVTHYLCEKCALDEKILLKLKHRFVNERIHCQQGFIATEMDQAYIEAIKLLEEERYKLSILERLHDKITKELEE